MRKRFTPEFKEEAASLVIKQGLTVKQAAADLGIGKSSLDKWLQRYRERQKDPNILSEGELAELKRLRTENRLLKMERDLLKKTAVYFAKGSDGDMNS